MAHRFPALIAAPTPAPGRLWLTGARLFDGTGAPLREHTAVLVEDGLVKALVHERLDCVLDDVTRQGSPRLPLRE